jgi:hypothetical protein
MVMKYDSGYINPRIRWVKLDGRNGMVKHYSHRITVRDRQNCNNVEKWFENNIAPLGDLRMYGQSFPTLKPRVLKKRETYTRYQVYLNEEDLVQFVIGYVT